MTTGDEVDIEDDPRYLAGLLTAQRGRCAACRKALVGNAGPQFLFDDVERRLFDQHPEDDGTGNEPYRLVCAECHEYLYSSGPLRGRR
jgi:hypothetical protein